MARGLTLVLDCIELSRLGLKAKSAPRLSSNGPAKSALHDAIKLLVVNIASTSRERLCGGNPGARRRVAWLLHVRR